MKIALLGVALILGGTAVVVRSSESLLAAPSRAPRALVQAESLAVEASTSPAAVEPPRAATSVLVPAKAVEAAAPSLPVPQALVVALERMLELTPLQKAQAEEIYRERDQQVEAYGREVALRGWAKLADFDLRVGELRNLAHRRLAAILDTAQTSVFALRIAKGIPEDSLSIEIPDGVVVLE